MTADSNKAAVFLIGGQNVSTAVATIMLYYDDNNYLVHGDKTDTRTISELIHGSPKADK